MHWQLTHRPRRAASAKHRYRTQLRFETLEPRYVLDSTVVFNEIMYHPVGNEEQLEWVELFNQMSVDMDLSGWKLAGGIDYEFANGTVLGGGEYLVLAISPAGLQAATGYAEALGPFTGRLSNGGEELQLLDRNDRIMDAVEYADTGEWPVEADGSGASLHKIDPMTASAVAANWSFSPSPGGTPGTDNRLSDLVQTDPISVDSTWRYHDLGIDLGTGWRAPDFNDSSWASGEGLFYDEDDPLPGPKNTPLNPGPNTYYFRKAFQFDGDPADVTSITVDALIDDGAVFYLNGVEVKRINMPSGAVSFDTKAVAEVDQAAFTGALTIAADSLVSGTNVLAVEVHQADPAIASTLAYYRFEETFGTSVRDALTGQTQGQLVGASRTMDVPAATVTQTGAANNRSVDFSEGHALITGQPFLFHDPSVGGAVGSATLEWFMKVPEPTGHSAIFWSNSDTSDEDRFNIFWGADFTGAPNGDRVVSGDFRRLGQPHVDIGNHSNGNPISLDEWHHIAIVRIDDTPADTTDSNFTWQWYIDGVFSPAHTRTTNSPLPLDDEWLIAGRQASSGAGVDALIDEVRLTQGALSPSQFLNAPDTVSGDDDDAVFGASLSIAASKSDFDVAINEMLPGGAGFQVELVNDGDTPVDLGGFVLTGTGGPGTTDVVLPSRSLLPGQFTTFNTNDLGFTPLVGDKLFLYAPGKATVLDGQVVDAVVRGRTADGTGDWLYPDFATMGTTNAFTFETDIVINEIMYHHQVVPDAGTGLALDSQEEWIELYNRGTSTVSLSGWQFADAIDFTFPFDAQLGPDEYLVVAGNAAELQTLFPAANIIGNFSRRLSNSDDGLRLLDARGNPADEVHYFDDKPWPKFADGGGSSLELRDPDADNSVAEAWAASDEAAKSAWQTYTYRGVAGPGDSGSVDYHELVLGLLDEGEVLLDDIRVIEDPDGLNRQLIQNGTFEGGTTDKWRIIGNHHGQVVTDPDDPANRALHLTATGRTDDVHNHVETTLKSGSSFVQIVPGREYEISYRAKWLGGSSLLNTRLYFFEVQETMRLETPQLNGTPGAQNSRFEANLGPTFSDLQHGPVVPQAGEAVVVSVRAQDPNGISSMNLRWRTNGGAWNGVPMSLTADGRYAGTIAGQPAGTIVQFYVQGTDTLGAVATFPADGVDSRALYVVDDGQAQLGTLHNVRVIMRASEISTLDTGTNLMSNDLLGATVIVNESDVYYDVGVRRSGASSSRQGTHGFRIKFHADQLFRGLHENVTVDRNHTDEIFVRHLINHAGDIPSMYNDLIHFVAPTSNRTGQAILRMAGFDDVYLDSQYEDGGDGTTFEKELTYRQSLSNPADVESLKVPFGYTHPVELNTDIDDFGTDPEAYRWHWLIKKHRDVNDYTGIVELNQALALTGTALEQAAAEILDVDQWLRALAVMRLFGNRDFYSQPKSTGASDSWNHNFWVYQRPNDDRFVFMPWDIDENFQVAATDPAIFGNGNVANLIQRPNSLHHYFGHLDDLINTTFNDAYMTDWANYFSSVLNGVSLAGAQSYINARTSYIRSRMPAAVDFELSDSTVDTVLVPESAPARVLIPSGASAIDGVWTGGDEAAFASLGGDTTWQSGTTGVGYERPGSGTDYSGLINLDVSAMDGGNNSVYVRMPFNVSSQSFLDDIAALTLKLRVDDGAVVYLNGHRVADQNAPVSPAWNSQATGQRPDAVALTPLEIDVSEHIDKLTVGENILAIHGLNYSPRAPSSDLLILPELIATSSNPASTIVDESFITVQGKGWINVREIRVVGQPQPLDVTWTSETDWVADVPLQFGENVLSFQAFDFQGNPIVTPADNTITVTSTASQQPYQDFLQISELMYHPPDPTALEDPSGVLEDDDFEFIEFFNSSATQTLDLAGVRITDGPSQVFEFTGSNVTSLGPGEFVLAVTNQAAFEARYGSDESLTSRIAGEYSGRFDNAGEQVTVVDPQGFDIHNFVYSDDPPWPTVADGGGPSLVLRYPHLNPDHGLVSNWTVSAAHNGSPAAADPAAGLLGDYNQNGEVDAADYSLWRDTLGSTIDLRADGNRNDMIDRGDYDVWKLHFGNSIAIAVGATGQTVLHTEQAAPTSPAAEDEPSRHAEPVPLSADLGEPDDQVRSAVFAEIGSRANSPPLRGRIEPPARHTESPREIRLEDDLLAIIANDLPTRDSQTGKGSTLSQPDESNEDVSDGLQTLFNHSLEAPWWATL